MFKKLLIVAVLAITVTSQGVCAKDYSADSILDGIFGDIKVGENSKFLDVTYKGGVNNPLHVRNHRLTGAGQLDAIRKLLQFKDLISSDIKSSDPLPEIFLKALRQRASKKLGIEVNTMEEFIEICRGVLTGQFSANTLLWVMYGYKNAGECFLSLMKKDPNYKQLIPAELGPDDILPKDFICKLCTDLRKELREEHPEICWDCEILRPSDLANLVIKHKKLLKRKHIGAKKLAKLLKFKDVDTMLNAWRKYKIKEVAENVPNEIINDELPETLVQALINDATRILNVELDKSKSIYWDELIKRPNNKITTLEGYIDAFNESEHKRSIANQPVEDWYARN